MQPWASSAQLWPCLEPFSWPWSSRPNVGDLMILPIITVETVLRPYYMMFIQNRSLLETFSDHAIPSYLNLLWSEMLLRWNVGSLAIEVWVCVGFSTSASSRTAKVISQGAAKSNGFLITLSLCASYDNKAARQTNFLIFGWKVEFDCQNYSFSYFFDADQPVKVFLHVSGCHLSNFRRRGYVMWTLDERDLCLTKT